MSARETIYLKDYKKPSFSIDSVELIFELKEEHCIVTNTMQLNCLDDSSSLELDTLELELLEVWMNDLKLQDTRYIIQQDKLIIQNTPKQFSLKIKNKIYPHKNTELEGLYKSGSIFCTQNEPEGFRRITPYLDRPDVMSVFTTTVIADKKLYPILLSNGNKKNTHNFMNSKHGTTWHDPHPKPSYLFALVAGDLGVISDEFQTASGEDIELNIYCDKGNESKCSHAMTSLKQAMLWDEEVYGREYDLEIYNIVAVDSFNMGAMENKGLNIFNSHFVLADETTASDADFMGIEAVIAHEYFHNWTGNRITCRDWFQLTLKEGLTVFRDQCFSGDLNSKEVQRIDDVKALRERQFVEDASPTAHPIQPQSYISMNNFYTSTVYEKGAEVIRMIHTLLGEKNFRKATDLYFKSFDGQAVTTNDFLWAMSEASGIDLKAFELWYHQSGTPSLMVEDSLKDGIYTLKLKQVIPNSVDNEIQKPLFFPLKMALIADEIIAEKTLVISKEYEEFYFEVGDKKPHLSINRDFSAPIIIQQFKTDYSFLIKHDTNSFIRYESTQSFGLDTLEKIIKTKKVDEEFLDAYGYLLELDVELSYKALLLELPSISTMMLKESTIDFEPLYSAKDSLELAIATRYEKTLLELYTTNHHPSSKSIDTISISQRAIKNRALRILASLKTSTIINIAKKQYDESITMSDRIVALDILANTKTQHATVALDDFYEKYKDDTLVMNKYFSIIASSSKENLLQRVIELQDDAAYDKKVPNLVRSLIGSFTRNYRYFHAKDGSGYSFIADKIIEIDDINPQMASALCGAFKLYEKMNTTNKNQMKKELNKIINTPKLSKNSYEIVDKIL